MQHSKSSLDFKALFEGAPDLFIVLLPNLTIVSVSDAFANTIFVNKEEIVGTYLFDVFLDNPESKNKETISKAIELLNSDNENKIIPNIPIQKFDIRNSKGITDEKYWSLTLKPIFEKPNQLQYIILRVEDVSEIVKLKKQQSDVHSITADLSGSLLFIENELLNRNKEIQDLNAQLELKIAQYTLDLENITKDVFDYQLALDAADIVAIANQKGEIIYANDNFCTISKYSRDELMGQNHEIINSGYHSKAFFRNLMKTISGGSIWKGEIKNRAKDGSVYWVDTTLVPFLNEKGEPYKYLAIQTDITDRKQSIENLKISEERYKDIFSNALVAIFAFDIQTFTIIDVNERGVDLFGYESKQDFISNFDSKQHYVNLRQRNKSFVFLVEKGELRNIQRMRRKDGSLFWGSFFIKLNDSRTFAQIVILDVTKQIDFQDELEAKVAGRTLELTESLAREKHLNEMKSNFLSIASHEFRTPLYTILSSSSLIKKYSETNQQEMVEKHVERITAAVDNLTNILNDFLTLEKLRKGFVDFEIQSFNLPEFISQTLDEVGVLVKMNDQRIKYQHSGESLVYQSPKILKNIVMNLISNASKYSDWGNEILVYSKILDDSVIISVQDYGIGIPKKEQKMLFTEFYRASNAKNVKGTGLGLSIVKNYVSLLEGTISFLSKLNKGTTFTITFPRQLSDS
jgi:PAS domain S-box-containing protein